MRPPERRPQPVEPLDGGADAHAVAASPAWQLVIGTRTDPGRARPRNEDYLYAEPPDSPDARAYGWFGAVADGVSSRPAGDVASSLAVHGARDAYYQAQADDTTERLHGAVEQANRVIHQAARGSFEFAGMASTIVAAVIRDGALRLAQVGNSRAYLVRDGQIHRLTRDHSWSTEGLRAGILSPTEARQDPRRGRLTRALGLEPGVMVDVIEGALRGGDALLLCTDGLHGLVDDAEILAHVGDDCQRTADALVRLANDRGGTDNVSVLVAHLAPVGQASPAGARVRAPAEHPPASSGGLLSSAVGSADRLEEVPRTLARAPRLRRAATLGGIAGLAAILTFGLLLLIESALPAPPPPLPAATPATPSAVGVVAIATPPPTEPIPDRSTGHFRPERTAYVRGAPRLDGRLLEELGPQAPRPLGFQILTRQRGDRPTDPSLPPGDQTDVWYEITWPSTPAGRAFVHCSAIELDSVPNQSCDPSLGVLPVPP